MTAVKKDVNSRLVVGWVLPISTVRVDSMKVIYDVFFPMLQDLERPQVPKSQFNSKYRAGWIHGQSW